MSIYFDNVIRPLKLSVGKDSMPLVDRFQVIWKEVALNDRFLTDNELYRLAWMMADEVDKKCWFYRFKESLDRKLMEKDSVTPYDIAESILWALVFTETIAWGIEV